MDDLAARLALGQLVEILARLGVVGARRVEELRVRLLLELGQKRDHRVGDVAHDAQRQMAAVAEALGADVDLRHRGALGIELAVGKVAAQQQQRVAGLHRRIARGEADQAGHADIERIVVLDMLLAAQRMHDRRVELARQLDDLGMRAGAARAAHQGDALAVVQELGQGIDVGIGRPHDRRLGRQPLGDLGVGRLQRDVARDHHHRDAALGDGDADRLRLLFTQRRPERGSWDLAR